MGRRVHNILLIFKRDLVRILKNPVALVVTLGVAVIPADRKSVV